LAREVGRGLGEMEPKGDELGKKEFLPLRKNPEEGGGTFEKLLRRLQVARQVLAEEKKFSLFIGKKREASLLKKEKRPGEKKPTRCVIVRPTPGEIRSEHFVILGRDFDKHKSKRIEEHWGEVQPNGLIRRPSGPQKESSLRDGTAVHKKVRYSKGWTQGDP